MDFFYIENLICKPKFFNFLDIGKLHNPTEIVFYAKHVTFINKTPYLADLRGGVRCWQKVDFANVNSPIPAFCIKIVLDLNGFT